LSRDAAPLMGKRGPVEIASGVHWWSAGALAGNVYFF